MKRTNTGNTAGVLEAVWMNEGISRIDLAKRLDIDKSTVSHLVASLLEQRLLEEYDQAEASSLGGRKPVKLRLNKDYGYTVGLEVQPDFYRVVVVNLKGEREDAFTAEASTDGENFAHRFDEVLTELGRRQPRYLARCLGVGVALSGIVDPFEGVVLESTSLGLRHARLLPTLARQRAFPVWLENDANAACWGEVVLQQSLRHDLRSFLFCLVEFHKRSGSVPSGVSVGLGFVINGRIHYGENFSAGEFRSLRWQPGRTFQFSLSDDEMARLPSDTALQQTFFAELSDHLLFLSRVFNLNSLYFGGELEPYRDRLSDALEGARRRAWPEGDCPCQVKFSTHGPDAVAFGAAAVALTKFFRQPEISARLNA